MKISDIKNENDLFYIGDIYRTRADKLRNIWQKNENDLTEVNRDDKRALKAYKLWLILVLRCINIVTYVNMSRQLRYTKYPSGSEKF